MAQMSAKSGGSHGSIMSSTNRWCFSCTAMRLVADVLLSVSFYIDICCLKQSGT